MTLEQDAKAAQQGLAAESQGKNPQATSQASSAHQTSLNELVSKARERVYAFNDDVHEHIQHVHNASPGNDMLMERREKGLGMKTANAEVDKERPMSEKVNIIKEAGPFGEELLEKTTHSMAQVDNANKQMPDKENRSPDQIRKMSQAQQNPHATLATNEKEGGLFTSTIPSLVKAMTGRSDDKNAREP